MRTFKSVTANIFILFSVLLVIGFCNNQIYAQSKGNSAYSKAEKLQRLLDLSDTQTAKVAEIIMSASNNNNVMPQPKEKNKFKFGNNMNEINMAIEQVLTVEQTAKFDSIRTTWPSMKVPKKDKADDDGEKVEKEKLKKEKKSKKNKSED